MSADLCARLPLIVIWLLVGIGVAANWWLLRYRRDKTTRVSFDAWRKESYTPAGQRILGFLKIWIMLSAAIFVAMIIVQNRICL